MDTEIAKQAAKIHAAFELERFWESVPAHGPVNGRTIGNAFTPHQRQRIKEALRKNTEDALLGMRGLLQSERKK